MEGVKIENNTTCESDVKTDNICKYYLEGICRFGEECFNIHPYYVPQKEPAERIKEERTRIEEDSDLGPQKKTRMRTAKEVINRIKWDADFNEDYFIVGYKDRFRGLLEDKFHNFTWEDLASLDWDTQAITQHSIQYFKYKTEKVWEKATRLDLVFGSTGSTIDIVEFMKQVDNPPDDAPLTDQDQIINDSIVSTIDTSYMSQKSKANSRFSVWKHRFYAA